MTSPITRKRWFFAYAALAPILAIYLFVRIIPIGRTFLMSFVIGTLLRLTNRLLGWRIISSYSKTLVFKPR